MIDPFEALDALEDAVLGFIRGAIGMVFVLLFWILILFVGFRIVSWAIFGV